MRILIIGATGFLGKKLFTILGKKNEVFGTSFSKSEAGFLKIDRTKAGEVKKLLEKINPDVLIDANGISNMDDCEVNLNDCWQSNVEGTKNLADACRAAGKKFVFISTDAVFYDKSKEFLEETAKREPVNYYAESKLAAEKYIENNLKNFLILRPSTLYGYNGPNDKIGFTNFVISNLSSGKEIKIVDDQMSCPTLIDDVAIALEKLLEKNQPGVFNSVGKDFVSKYDFALKIAEVFGLDKSKIIRAKLSEMKFEAPRPASLNLSIEKIKRLGISMRGVEDGLREMKKQMDENQ